MKIDNDHLYHGAALLQIAEHPQFTAINVFSSRSGISRSAFRINDSIGVYLKYATRPHHSYNEYVFNFLPHHLTELRLISRKVATTFVALVCVEGRAICALPYSTLVSLIDARRTAFGGPEEQYTVLVELPERSNFRVYMNEPGTKGRYLGKPLKIARNRFPNALFG